MEQKYNRKKAMAISLLKYIQTAFFGVFIFLGYFAIKRAMGLVGNLFFGVCGLLTIVFIMADYGMKEGAVARNMVNLHGEKPCRNFGAMLGLVASAPSYIMTIILVLSKLGVVGNFLPLYKLVNPCYSPLFLISADTTLISDVSWAGMLMPILFPLLYIVSTWIGFKISYDNVDIRDKIVFKNK